jgi:colanic acid/amylovoran biosynthesis glycosyltransferase
MRRILHVVNAFGIVSETFVADAIAGVDANGCESWLATMQVTRRDRFPYPPDERLIVAPRPGPARRVVDRALRRSFTERFGASILDRARVAAPDVVHAHFGWSAIYAEPLSRMLGAPLVTTFHGSDVNVFPHEHGRGVYEPLFKVLGHALPVSEQLADRLRELNYAGPITVIPAGVRLDKFPLRDVSPSSEGALTVLHVGRLTERKGVDLLVRAIAELDPDVKLEVVGDGPERMRLEQLAVDLGVSARVTFQGAGSPDEVARALRRAHVLVMASRTLPSGEAEGNPVVLKEAMAVGVPFVATANGGIPEMVPPELRGELVPEENVPALVEAIRSVLGDRAGWPERAAVGRQWVASAFDASQLGARTVQVYDQLLAGGVPLPPNSGSSRGGAGSFVSTQ